jgi:hypothetical protein
MRVEELEQTAKLAIDSGGKGMKAQVGGFAGKSGETHMSYLDDMSARLEVVDRISSLDLRALGVGEACRAMQGPAVHRRELSLLPSE